VPDSCRNSLVVRRLIAAALLCALGATPAQAHKLKVFASAEGNTVTGLVYFPGGGKARNIKVEIRTPGGEALGETRTDDKGAFQFKARFRCDHEFIVDSGDGHRATYVLKADELPDHLPSRGRDPSSRRPRGPTRPAEPEPEPETPAAPHVKSIVETAVARQLRPLREQIERYEEKRRLHEIIGGIGYIFGIMGLVLYFKRNAKRRT